MDSQPMFITHVAEPRARRALEIPSSFMVHLIPNIEEPVITEERNSVFLSRYPQYNKSKKPLSRDVKNLTFLHVGSDEAPDVSDYVHSCKSIDFFGHICSTNAVLQIVKQLLRLENITIFLRPSHRNYFQETHKKTPWCPSVTTLKIIVDVDYFDNCSPTAVGNGMQDYIIYTVESLLLSAKGSFPNLKKLVLVLPRNQRLYKEVQTLIQCCYRLRRYFYTTDFQKVPTFDETKQVWYVGPRSQISLELNDLRADTFKRNGRTYMEKTYGYPLQWFQEHHSSSQDRCIFPIEKNDIKIADPGENLLINHQKLAPPSVSEDDDNEIEDGEIR